MGMNWYYRLLLSYTPIFFLIISSLIFVLFTSLNRASKDQYLETNRAIIRQMVHYTDANLQLIERNVVSEMYRNETLQSFFEDTPKSVYDYFLIQKSMRELASSFPFAVSLYLYDESTGEFLTAEGRYSRDTFGDVAYFTAAYNEGGKGWTDPRDYRPADRDRTERVVTLFKYYPYASGKDGAFVVNVHVKSILEQLSRLNRNAGDSITILDRSGQPFAAPSSPERATTVHASSPYTGWQFHVESVLSGNFSVLSALSNIWSLFGLTVIVLSIVWFTVMTHWKFKPIRTIVGKIGGYTAHGATGSGGKAPRDQLKWIEGAIDHLLEKSMDYEQMQKEGLQLRQRNLFHDLLIGNRTLTDLEWQKQMESFGLPHAYERLAVVVLEIDRYARFAEQYNERDQYLLKYIIEAAIRELVQSRELFTWQVWTQPRRLAVVFHLEGRHEPHRDTIRHLCRALQEWVRDHLELTVSAGIGDVVDSIGRIADSFRSADRNVSFKAVFGMNALIDQEAKKTKEGGEQFNWLHALLEMAHHYRRESAEWEDKLQHIFAELKRTLLSQADLANLLNNLVHQLQKAFGGFSREFLDVWQEEYVGKFRKIADHAETIDELQDQTMALMRKLAREIEQERINRRNQSVAYQIKAYIDRHYADPNLSLNQVSDRFGISPKSVSQLFKEEVGEKFLDYLLQVRFDRAKQMLRETDEPVQSIAEQVGYHHVISFHRAFKKQVGMPPGEYCNLHRQRP